MSNQVLERLKREYNETVERLQDLAEIICNCDDMGDHRSCQNPGLPCGGPVIAKRVVYDPNESQPVDVLRTKEDVEKRLGIHIHEGNIPGEQWGSLKTLLGMEVIGVGKGKCEGCPQDHYGTPCIKVELVGGAYICLAPTPQLNRNRVSHEKMEQTR